MSVRRTIAQMAAIMLLLAACGGGEAAEETGAAGEETTAADGETEAAGGSGDGECTLDEPVPVGAVFSLTGGAAVFGATQANGLQLAIDELNERGGVTYELIQEDDGSDPAQGITAFEKLISQDQVSVIIGPTLSNTAFSTDPIAQEAGVPVVAVSNTAEGITEMGEFIFRDSLAEAQVIPQTIAQAKEALGLERVAVLYGDDDAFTQSGAEVFLDVLEQEGIEVTTTQTFAKGDTDFSAQLTEARDTDPDALVVSALAEEGSLILTQARDLGLDVPVIGGNGFNSPAIAQNAGEAAEGLIVGAAWNSASDVPANQEFLASYEEAFGEAPDQFAAQAHAGMNIVDAAVRSACSSDPAAIRDALAQVSGLDTVLGEFSFTEDRNADHEAVVQVIENGEFAILE
jgi:branched-chain amino acid transport system substrate-binding protein